MGRIFRQFCPIPMNSALRGCLKSLHGFLQRYPHAMVIVDFRELRTIVTSSEAALHQLKTLMSGLFKQPLRGQVSRECFKRENLAGIPGVDGGTMSLLKTSICERLRILRIERKQARYRCW